MAWISYWDFILYIVLPPWAGSCLGMGLSSFNPAFTLFVGRLTPLPHCPVISDMLSFDLCLLGLSWAYCIFFLLLSSSSPVLLLGLYSCYFGLPWPVSSLWGSLGPFYSFRHPWPVSILHSHGLLLSILGFLGLDYYIFYFWGL